MSVNVMTPCNMNAHIYPCPAWFECFIKQFCYTIGYTDVCMYLMWYGMELQL